MGKDFYQTVLDPAGFSELPVTLWRIWFIRRFCLIGLSSSNGTSCYECLNCKCWSITDPDPAGSLRNQFQRWVLQFSSKNSRTKWSVGIVMFMFMWCFTGTDPAGSLKKRFESSTHWVMNCSSVNELWTREKDFGSVLWNPESIGQDLFRAGFRSISAQDPEHFIKAAIEKCHGS